MHHQALLAMLSASQPGLTAMGLGAMAGGHGLPEQLAAQPVAQAVQQIEAPAVSADAMMT